MLRFKNLGIPVTPTVRWERDIDKACLYGWKP